MNTSGKRSSRPKMDIRIQLMISTDELQAVDDFRFANRCHTRAEAIRLLFKLGIAAAQSEPESTP